MQSLTEFMKLIIRLRKKATHNVITGMKQKLEKHLSIIFLNKKDLEFRLNFREIQILYK